jgi:hypothetical protein
MVVSARACLRRQDGWQADALLLIWMLAPLALMSFQGSQVYIHYVLCLVPVPFLLIGRGAGWLAGHDSPLGSRRSGLGWGVGASVGAIVLVQTLAVVAFYAELDRIASAPPAEITATDWQLALNREDLKARQMGIGELHGLPLRYWQTVADQTRAVAGGTGLHGVTVVTGILDADDRHLDRRRKALAYLLGPDLDVRVPLEGLTVVPSATDPLFLTVPDQELPRVVQRAATKQAEIRQPGTSSATRVYAVRARPADETITLRRRANLPIADGLRLAVLDLPPQVRPGQTVPLAAYIEVEDSTRLGNESLIPYVELVGPASGHHVIARRGGLDSADWRTGDLLIQQMSLTVPVDYREGDYDLRIGLASGDDVDAAPSDAVPAVKAAVLKVRNGP